MLVKLKFLVILYCLLIVSISYGNQTEWPHWLLQRQVVTLLLNSETSLFGRSKVNAIQINPVSEWAKSGNATLGFIGKNGEFQPKIEVEYSEHGPAAISIDEYVITDKLEINTKDKLRKVGSAEILESIQETVLKDSKTMPYFDIPRQQFQMSNEFIFLEKPIKIGGVKVSVLYFEPYFSTYPGSQVHFGNLDSKGIFTDAQVNTRMWSYISGGGVLIHLETQSHGESLVMSTSTSLHLTNKSFPSTMDQPTIGHMIWKPSSNREGLFHALKNLKSRQISSSPNP